jgi:hypothetical protein
MNVFWIHSHADLFWSSLPYHLWINSVHCQTNYEPPHNKQLILWKRRATNIQTQSGGRCYDFITVFVIYRVALKSVNLKHSLILTGMFEPVREVVERYNSDMDFALNVEDIVTCQPIVGLRNRSLRGSRPVNKSSAQPRWRHTSGVRECHVCLRGCQETSRHPVRLQREWGTWRNSTVERPVRPLLGYR